MMCAVMSSEPLWSSAQDSTVNYSISDNINNTRKKNARKDSRSDGVGKAQPPGSGKQEKTCTGVEC